MRALSLPGRSLAVAALVALAACSNDAPSVVAPVDTDSPAALSPESFTPLLSSIAGASFWVDPYSNAKKTANAWRTTRPADALQMDKIANTSGAKWIGSWNTNVQYDVNNYTTTTTAAGKLPVFVAYNIPQRDCGGLSGGNTTTANAYKTWITGFANGIGTRKAIVVIEPDALPGMDCLSATDQQARVSLLNYAVQQFAAKGNIATYLDAGNPRWKSASTIAKRLISAGVAQANGFSLNVSNFYFTSDNITYGTQVSALIGNRHFIIDTGRNGRGPTADYQWCNPTGRALGNRPTTQTGNALVDAFLWIKTPGESDGACNGNPAAGAWMAEYALGLAQRAAY
jgi:endoglucanase